jgi:hypothetical protein
MATRRPFRSDSPELVYSQYRCGSAEDVIAEQTQLGEPADGNVLVCCSQPVSDLVVEMGVSRRIRPKNRSSVDAFTA